MGLTGWWAAGRSQPDQSGRCKVEHPFPPDQDGSRSPAKQKKAQLHAPAYIISNLQLFTIIFRPLNSRMIHDRPTSWPAPLETHQPLSDDVNANSEINQKLPRLKAGKVYKCPNATFFSFTTHYMRKKWNTIGRFICINCWFIFLLWIRM